MAWFHLLTKCPDEVKIWSQQGSHHAKTSLGANLYLIVTFGLATDPPQTPLYFSDIGYV